MTAEAPATELAALPKAQAPVARSARVLGLPRSGTTLLEQMLDCHSKVCGVGETPMRGRMAGAIAQECGGWPLGAMRASGNTLNGLQQRHLTETRRHCDLPADLPAFDAGWDTLATAHAAQRQT